MSGPRKQRYVLDVDDLVRRGFMTKANADQLLLGINESETDQNLAVIAGGTNNREFVDQELLLYDAVNKRFVSSGYTPLTISQASVFVPYVTGILFSDSGVDKSNTSLSTTVLVNQSFSLPENALWVDLDLSFGFCVSGASSTMSALEVLIGNDSGSSPLIKTSYTGPYTGLAGDQSYVSWRATGSIPTTHQLDNPLSIFVRGIPQDLAAARSCVTRMSFRHGVAPPVGGGSKGVPVFLSAPVVVPTNVTLNEWHDFDITSCVPAGSSAVLIQSRFITVEAGYQATVYYRIGEGGVEYILGQNWTESEENDMDTDANQGMYPFKSLAGVRSFQYKFDAPIGSSEIKVIGYIT